HRLESIRELAVITLSAAEEAPHDIVNARPPARSADCCAGRPSHAAIGAEGRPGDLRPTEACPGHCPDLRQREPARHRRRRERTPCATDTGRPAPVATKVRALHGVVA